MATSLVYEPLNSQMLAFPTQEASEGDPNSEAETSDICAHNAAASLQTRQAELRDAKAIHLLIHSYAHDGTLLPRSYTEICQNIRTFTVVETDDGDFLAVPRCTSTGSTSPRYAPSSFAQSQQVAERGAFSCSRSSSRCSGIASDVSVSSLASRPSLSDSASVPPNIDCYATKSGKTVSIARDGKPATKSR